MDMEKSDVHSRSHLFTIRVWEEKISLDQTELRGKVQLFTNGEVRYFREWVSLTPLLVALLSELDTEREASQ